MRSARSSRHLGRATNGHLETILLVANIAVIMGFLVFISYSKHLHIFVAPLNVLASRRPRALGPLYSTPDMDMENVDEDTVFGAGHIEDFSWKQLLDLYSCTECGRCQDACPAWTTGKPLSPKLLVMGLRDNLFRVRSSSGAESRPVRAQEGRGEQRRTGTPPTRPRSLLPPRQRHRHSCPGPSIPTCCGPA